MCGIFGVIAGGGSTLPPRLIADSLTRLYRLSETRGKESAGLAALADDDIRVLKQPIPASRFIRTSVYRRVVDEVVRNGNGHERPSRPIALMGHSRLVTNGAQEDNENNQPVVAGGMVGIHNGIIVNDAELWRRYPDMHRQHEVDTEVLLSLIRRFQEQGENLIEAARRAFAAIEGCAAVSVFFSDFDQVLLATNNGSLYLCRAKRANACIYASEEYILEQLLHSAALREKLGEYELTALQPGDGRLIDLQTGAVETFRVLGGDVVPLPLDGGRSPRRIVDLSSEMEPETRGYRTAAYSPKVSQGADNPELLFEGKERIDALQRCTRCLIPESFPFIDFDEHGVCTYCRNYRPIQPLGEDRLRAAVEPFRSRDGRPDCLVGISGGRDSCHGLHYLKRVLGLNPIAYTYDWGMVTDLARRNISRMCAKLGIEHILISADINWKRANIRKNVRAWLKRPDLGIVPLFMAGDKSFYFYANQLKKRTGIKLFLFCAGNRYETTDFKIGFCGIRANSATGILRMSAFKSAQLVWYYGKQYLLNPAYFNQSVLDTIGAFFSSYMMPHDYLYLYHYLRWDEREIMDTLVGQYGWETADDTAATWRIGDGTAAFYNYIYLTVAGFTEMDTFRSHQIRAGALDRETALRRVKEENAPRYKSIKWYLNSIGMDLPFNEVIGTINAIPKLY